LPWRELEHTADVGLEVWAETLEDLVAESARAFYALLFGAEARRSDASFPPEPCGASDSGAAETLSGAARKTVPEVGLPGAACTPRDVSSSEFAPEPAVACPFSAASRAVSDSDANFCVASDSRAVSAPDSGSCAVPASRAAPGTGTQRRIEVEALDAVELFVSWLNELLFLLEVRGERLCLRSVRLTVRAADAPSTSGTAGGAILVPDPALDPTCALDTCTGAVCPERSAGVVGATTGLRGGESENAPGAGAVVGVHPGVTSADAEHATGDTGSATENAPGTAFSLVVEGSAVPAPAPSLGIKAVTYGGALVMPGPPVLLRLFFDV